MIKTILLGYCLLSNLMGFAGCFCLLQVKFKSADKNQMCFIISQDVKPQSRRRGNSNLFMTGHSQAFCVSTPKLWNTLPSHIQHTITVHF